MTISTTPPPEKHNVTPAVGAAVDEPDVDVPLVAGESCATGAEGSDSQGEGLLRQTRYELRLSDGDT